MTRRLGPAGATSWGSIAGTSGTGKIRERGGSQINLGRQARAITAIGLSYDNGASANFEQVTTKEDLSGLPAWARKQRYE